MTLSANSLFAQVPGLADSFNNIFNSPVDAAPAPAALPALPAPNDIHSLGDDEEQTF